MTIDDDTLASCALGLGTAADQAAIDADPSATAQLRALRDLLAELPRGLTAERPSPAVWARLLSSVGGGRFDRFVARFAAMYDLAIERAGELLGWVDQPARWLPAVPGVSLIHFRGGPAVATADCGMLRVAPGTSFPWHAHKGEELSLFIAGRGRDHDGVIYAAGDELLQAPGSAHDFTTISDDDLIVCVRYDGVDFTAQRPGS